MMSANPAIPLDYGQPVSAKTQSAWLEPQGITIPENNTCMAPIYGPFVSPIKFRQIDCFEIGILLHRLLVLADQPEILRDHNPPHPRHRLPRRLRVLQSNASRLQRINVR